MSRHLIVKQLVPSYAWVNHVTVDRLLQFYVVNKNHYDVEVSIRRVPKKRKAKCKL